MSLSGSKNNKQIIYFWKCTLNLMLYTLKSLPFHALSTTSILSWNKAIGTEENEHVNGD